MPFDRWPHRAWRIARIVGLVVAPVVAAAQRAPYPLASAPFARRALGAPDARWRKLETPRAEVYVLSGSAAEAVLATVTRDADRAIADNVAWLGGKDTLPKLRLFLVGSRAEMKRFVGEPRGGGALPAEGTAIFVANDSVHPALRHETMHVLSTWLWGSPPGLWAYEGLATASVGLCRGRSVEEIVAAMDRAGVLVSLDALRDHFNINGDIGIVYYYQGASLVRYIERVYGRERLRQLWAQGGLARTKETLGVNIGALDRAWRATIERSAPKTSWAALLLDIKAHGCE